MIISDKFIFVRVPRTASSSMEKFLKKYYEEKYNKICNFSRSMNLSHMSIKTLKERLPLYIKYSDYTINSGLLTANQCTHLSAYFLREHSILLNNNRQLFFKLKHA